MKNKITLLPVALIIFMASCTTSYKNTQTVDDVYYSPVKNIPDVQEDSDNDITEERQIRMSTIDPRWRSLDYQYNYDYNYNPYRYSYGYGYYYNPYYYAYPVYYYPGLSYIKSTNTTPRMTNLGAYTPIVNPVKNPKINTTTTGRRAQPYNTDNSGSTRRVLRSSSDSRSNTNDTRTYSPPSSSSSSNSGSGGGSTPVNRPSRP